MSISIGVTGGIGSGKSIVSELLEIMGIPVYISDIRSKWLTDKDPFIKKELINLFGDEVYQNGRLDKAFLSAHIFNNSNCIKTVNSIIHPKVKEDFLSWKNKCSDKKIIAIESAILVEAGFTDVIDKLIVVCAPLDLRIKRIIKRDSSSKELIMKRIQNQMEQKEKIKYADYVVYNDDYLPLIPQLEKIVEELQS